MYEPPARPQEKGWFSWGGSSDQQVHSTPSAEPQDSSAVEAASHRVGEGVSAPVEIGTSGLIATLRNVFIPTPNPDEAPFHPADPLETSILTATPAKRHSLFSGKNSGHSAATSASSSTTSLDSGGAGSHKKGKAGKLVDYINTLEISSPENASSKEAVVMLHGYAAALGFFFRNWESVAQSANATGRRTFFLDWLGMGLSSRPSPSLLSSPASAPIPNRVARAEHFFLSSLENWRASEGIEKMVLIGHSLGGYLASAYAVRYPERVSSLILVSPAGIPHGPEYVKYPTSAELAAGAKMPSVTSAGKPATPPPVPRRTGPGGKPIEEESASSGREEAVDAAEAEMRTDQHEAKGEAKQWRKDREQAGLVRKNMMKFFVWGWEKGLSPFSFLRAMGPWAPMFAGRYATRRFAAQNEEDIRDLHAYIYNTSIMKGSGEYCISHILAPGAYARIPIVDRIGQLKVPVSFLYGDNDWMDVDGGHASVKELAKAGNDRAKVHVVKGAGHHVYLDNPDDTNEIIDAAIKAAPSGL